MANITTVIIDGQDVSKTALRAWLNDPDITGAMTVNATMVIRGASSVGYLDVDTLQVRNLAGSSAYATFTATDFKPGADNTRKLGIASLRWSEVFAGTGTINTSDEREKAEIGAIPDEWLDAWANVEYRRFKFKESVLEKGDNARWHTGLVAQQVHAAFAAHGIDAFAIGLCCFDEWQAVKPKREVAAVKEVKDRAGNVLAPAQPAIPAVPGQKAGNRWGLRSDECDAVEAAYQRRRMAAIEKRLAMLKTP